MQHDDDKDGVTRISGSGKTYVCGLPVDATWISLGDAVDSIITGLAHRVADSGADKQSKPDDVAKDQ